MSILRTLLPSQPSNALLPEKWNVLCKSALKFIQHSPQIPMHKMTVTFICRKDPNARIPLRATSASENQRKTEKKESFWQLQTGLYGLSINSNPDSAKTDCFGMLEEQLYASRNPLQGNSSLFLLSLQAELSLIISMNSLLPSPIYYLHLPDL